VKRASMIATGILVLVLLFEASAIGEGEPPAAAPGQETPAEARLEGMAERLRLLLTYSTLAILSPTLADQRVHVQWVVNLLEGTGGRHFVPRLSPEGEVRGLVAEARALAPWILGKPIEAPLRDELRFFAKNIEVFVGLALQAALESLNQRHLEQGGDEMRKAFAFLAAALGSETGPTYLGGVLAVIRLLPGFPAA
jgi:hypothetical protein